MANQNPQYAPIVPFLAHSAHPSRREPIPTELIGARILAFGTLDGGHPERGGLAIEFERPDGSRGRVVFGFDEREMYLVNLEMAMTETTEADEKLI